jgi:enamine deaminase RidA (YjgF/YER057c/UK114 family)
LAYEAKATNFVGVALLPANQRPGWTFSSLELESGYGEHRTHRSGGLLRNPTFSQVAITTRPKTIFTSGQVSIDEQGKLVGGSYLREQTQQAMRNLGLALAAAGASFADVVKTTTFVVGFKPEHRTVITDAKAPFYDGRKPPASALIGVSGLANGEWLIEIEAIASID